jgi:hypothetical protein
MASFKIMHHKKNNNNQEQIHKYQEIGNIVFHPDSVQDIFKIDSANGPGIKSIIYKPDQAVQNKHH